MNIVKLIGLCILGHMLCINMARDYSFPELSYKEQWRIFTFPLSRLTHENIFSDRGACGVNIGAFCAILYIFITTVARIPIKYPWLHSLYGLWIFAILAFEMFKQHLYLFKSSTTGVERRCNGFLLGIGLFTSLLCFIMFLWLILAEMLFCCF